MSKDNGYKDQCGSCIYLNTNKPCGRIGFKCENEKIRHTHMGYIRYKHSPACKKGYESKDGFKYPQTKNKTWFNDETLKEHDRQVIAEFVKKASQAMTALYEQDYKNFGDISVNGEGTAECFDSDRAIETLKKVEAEYEFFAADKTK